ncbi:YdiK family protein [Pseudoneobacillus rhizosphaerae]|uniref:DUF4305 domain-containing protein n=1 Tax=Pseudoneobacillus rhizosphaerae TaxID=2880968 RepID=A0A9C7LCI0_9BACI|nr:YdiK family protein [Pseudoneobacillus rhizosphaerae]CAG9610332.1 hypothetical protein NEOCIP111885_04106 [Pseudoneobacillus rhizosphaerae]
MRQTPLVSGFLYLILAVLFTYFAIKNVQEDGWGFFSYLLIILATFDLGSGLKMIAIHYKMKKTNNTKK